MYRQPSSQPASQIITKGYVHSTKTPVPIFFLKSCQPQNLCLGGLCLELSLGLATDLDAFEDVLTILVDLELGDDDLGWVNTEWDGCARGLLLDETLDVDEVLETIDGGDLALAALVDTTGEDDFVVLADWHGADL